MTSYMIITASGSPPAEKLIMVKELCPFTDGEGGKVCRELCQSINVCVEHQPACYSFKYERGETGGRSDRQAANR